MTDLSKESTIPIHETFQDTIQGEGAWTGIKCDFIRLWGCPVGCHWCDTGYSDGNKNIKRSQRTINELLEEVKNKHVVVSGGEPFIHQHLPFLVKALNDNNRYVHIETSGAFLQDFIDDPPAWITLSPKEHLRPQFPVTDQAWTSANEVKIVIETGYEIDFYKEHLSRFDGPVYLQPEWNSKEKAIPIILSLLTKHPEWRLSAQLHKLIEVQ